MQRIKEYKVKLDMRDQSPSQLTKVNLAPEIQDNESSSAMQKVTLKPNK